MSKNLFLALMLAGFAAPSSGFAGKVNWPTYGFDSLRTSYNPFETAIGEDTVKNLTELWSFNAAAFDVGLNMGLPGARAVLGGQPIVAAGVKVLGVATDLVLVGDNNGIFFALDANSTNPAGSVVWYRSLGTKAVGAPINANFGIRGTAALGPGSTGAAVYVSDNTQIFGLDLPTGATLSGWPVSVVPAGAPDTDGEIHDALNLVDNHIFVGTSAIGQDQPPYYARVAVVSTVTHQVSTSWFPLSGTSEQPTVSGGGIWGWGGVAVDPKAAAGGVYVATGNAVGAGQQQMVYAENVINLSHDLRHIAGAATPAFGLTGDDDYGSTPLVFTPSCGTKLLVVKNKTGQVEVETVAANGALSLVASPLISTTGGTEFKGTAAFDPVDQLVLMTLNTPAAGTSYQPGLAAFKVSCAAPYLTLAWQAYALHGTPIMASGGHISSPTVANGLAFFGAETLSQSGKSTVYAALTRPDGAKPAGTIVWKSRTVDGTFDSALPTVVNGELLFATMGSQPTLYAFGLSDTSARGGRAH